MEAAEGQLRIMTTRSAADGVYELHNECKSAVAHPLRFPIKGFRYDFEIQQRYQLANTLQSFTVGPP